MVIARADCDCRKQCPAKCGRSFKKGEFIVTEFGSAQYGKVTIRWWHLECFVNSEQCDTEIANIFFKCSSCGKIKGTNEQCRKCRRLMVVTSL